MQPSSSKSLVTIYLQDESTLQGRTTLISLTGVSNGPEDQYCAIDKGSDRVDKKNNNFVYDPNFKHFGSINAFGVSSSTLRMYHKSMEIISKNPAFRKYLSNWTSHTQKLIIYPYHPDELQANAYYYNDELHFFSFYRQEDPDKLYHTSHSFDIVAHETGHAVLDRLRPDLSRSDLHTCALHESFGDCSSMFAILDNPVLRHELLLVTHGDLKQKSFLPTLAEAFGEELGRKENGLRNAAILTSMENVGDTDDYHYLSEVFTGSVYDVLADEFDVRQDEEEHLRSEDVILNQVGVDLRETIIKAFLEAPSVCVYAKMAELVMKNCSSRRIAESFRKAFEKRGVLDAWKSRDVGFGLRPSVCGTVERQMAHSKMTGKEKKVDIIKR